MTEHMARILIVAEPGIGRLIQKYLEREYVVAYAENTADAVGTPSSDASDVVVVDQSHLGDELPQSVAALAAHAPRARFVVLCSMESAPFCEELIQALAGHPLTTVFKPIKFSELAGILRSAS